MTDAVTAAPLPAEKPRFLHGGTVAAEAGCEYRMCSCVSVVPFRLQKQPIWGPLKRPSFGMPGLGRVGSVTGEFGTLISVCVCV